MEGCNYLDYACAHAHLHTDVYTLSYSRIYNEFTASCHNGILIPAESVQCFQLQWIISMVTCPRGPEGWELKGGCVFSLIQTTNTHTHTHTHFHNETRSNEREGANLHSPPESCEIITSYRVKTAFQIMLSVPKPSKSTHTHMHMRTNTSTPVQNNRHTREPLFKLCAYCL